jgi:mevalonate kinase
MIQAKAPGKIILCGEHAVVYQRPAIALPLNDVSASVTIQAHNYNELCFSSPDLGQQWTLNGQPQHPLSELVRNTLQQLGIKQEPAAQIKISSSIPIASGMGSGAAIATAIVRVLAEYYNIKLSAAEVSALVYSSEQRYHGTPSGIDNTVIAFQQPIWFCRQPHGSPIIKPISIAKPFTLLIGDTNKRSPTHLPVGDVRARREQNPQHYDQLFDQVEQIAHAIRQHLAQGQIAQLGPLLNQNQQLLQQIGVSSPELETLIAAARQAGALGAKLSGAGWGGVMIALVEEQNQHAVKQALLQAGASSVLESQIHSYQA